MMIVNDDSRVINKLEASLPDDARVLIYNHYLFIVQATEPTQVSELSGVKNFSRPNPQTLE